MILAKSAGIVVTIYVRKVQCALSRKRGIKPVVDVRHVVREACTVTFWL